MKLVTKKDVETEALHQIKTHGETTTLDVKNALRSDKIWATQQVVSEFMAELANEGRLSFSDNGVHRIYREPAPTLTTTFGSGISWYGANTTHVTSGYVTPVSPNVAQAKTILNVGDYEVRDKFGNNSHTYNNVTRGQAKWQWVKDTGFGFFDARTIKLS